MNNKIMKIMGVVLTLAILAGLLVMALPFPVSAATESWSTITGPKVYQATSANVFAMAADGKTIYLYANAAPGYAATTDSNKLYKSVDGGVTWAYSGLDTSLKITGLHIIQIAVDQASATDVVCTDGNHIFRSTNGGQTFQQYDPSGFAAPFTSVDIANGVNNTVAYLAGAGDGVYMYDPDTAGGWVKLGPASWPNGVAAAVAFSPTYANDTIVVAVQNNVGASIKVRAMVVSDATTSQWNVDVGDAVIVGNIPDANTIASIAFPADYNWASSASNRVFVGIGDTAPTSTTTDVWRINGAGTGSKAYNLGSGLNVSSVAFVGNVSSGILVAGQYNGLAVYSATNANTTTPTWINSTNNPTGTAATADLTVKFTPTSTTGAYTLYAGAAGVGSGLAVSSDLNSFAEIGLFSVSAYASVALPSGGLTGAGAQTQWQKMVDNGNVVYNGVPNSMIFKSVDSGVTWREIYSNQTYSYGPFGGAGLLVSPDFATTNTLYIQQGDVIGGTKYSNRIVKSSDAGATWVALSTPGNTYISAMAVVDANTYWIGSASGVRLSSSATTVNLDGTTPLVMVAIPGFFVVWTWSGEVYVSTDMGATFSRLGNLNQFNDGTGTPGPHAAKLTFDVPSKTIYCVEVSTGNIVKWTVGTDTSWTVAMNASNMPTSLLGFANISSISIGPAGVWYIQAPKTNTKGQLWRSVDALSPTAGNNYDFEAIPGSTFGYDATHNYYVSTIPFMAITVDKATGNPTFYTCVHGPTATNNYADTYMSFTDVVLNAPKTTAPAANATLTSPVDFSWTAVGYTGAKYDVQVAYDSAFGSIAATSTTTTVGTDQNGNPVTTYNYLSSIVFAGVQLAPGKTYFWRVRVAPGNPMASQWSAPVSFTTAVTSIATPGIDVSGRISPANGSTGVPTTPAITWGSVPGATYNFKLATDAAFTQIVDSKDGISSTAYTPAAPLKPSTTYFWEVQAVQGTNSSNWVVSAFTTAAPPSTAPPSTGGGGTAPVVTVNPPAITVNPPAVNVAPPAITVAPPNVTVNTAAPSTPAYIWVIIAIGAVLVIAVIVLIARTRRSA